jgi:iron(III) transport system permease protein
MGRWRLAVAFFLVAFLGLPLALPLVHALGDLGAWPLWSERARLLVLAGNTALLVAGTLALAIPTGVVGAILLYRTDIPLRRGLRFLTVATLFIPLPLFASGWQAALGSGGLIPLASWTAPESADPDVSATGIAWKAWGHGLRTAIWVHAVAGLPWVVWLVGRGLCCVEPELEEDALTLMPPARVLWHVTLRRSTAAIGAAALWVALQTATEVTVTDMMQVRTYAEEVYDQFVRSDRALIPRLIAVSMPSVLLASVLVLWTTHRWQRNLPPMATLTRPPRLFALGRWRWPCLLIVLLVVAVLALVPFASLVWKAGLAGSPEAWSLSALFDALNKATRAQSVLVLRSLTLAAAAGILAGLIGLVTCWLAIEASRFRTFILLLVAVTWAMPAPVVGVGLKNAIALLLDICGRAEAEVAFYRGPWSDQLEYWIELISQQLAIALYHGPSAIPALWVDLLRYFPFAVAVLWPVVRLLPSELRDAARVDGARPWQELRHVVAPLTRSAVLRAALAVAVLSLGELGAGKLVETPGSETFAHELFSQMHYGTGSNVAALCLLLLIPVLCGGVLIGIISRVSSE